jgi:hypothetical protein
MANVEPIIEGITPTTEEVVEPVVEEVTPEVETPAEPTEQAVEPIVEAPVEPTWSNESEVKPIDPVCANCKGEGLVLDNNKWVTCNSCIGTGKVGL